MKVCILSMQMVDNMGSLLQSFALKRILEEMNVQVEFWTLHLTKKITIY